MNEELNMDSVSVNSDEQARLNATSTKRANTINNVEAMEEILSKMDTRLKKPFGSNNMKWSERLIVVSSKEIQIMDNTKVNNDVQREVQFYNICLENTTTGLQKIADEGLKLDRPPDFMAEMFKTDKVMTKIRSSLVKQQIRVRNYEEQQLKKYSKKIQKQRRHQKNLDASKAKKANNNAIQKWKSDVKQKGGAHLVADLDEYVKNETARRNQNKKFQNLKSKRIGKRNRPGKQARKRNFGKRR
jgi:rRNA-processing protein EBP2